MSRGRNAIVAAVLAALAAMDTSSAAPVSPAPPGDPAPFVVNDFEKSDAGVAWRASSFARVPDAPDSSGHAARWTIPGSDRDAILYLETAPKDITPWRLVRFRMRRESETAPIVYLRLLCSDDDEFQVRVPGVSKEWKTFEVDLDSLLECGAPDFRGIKSICFGINRKRAAVFLVDDVVLDTARTPPDPEAEKRAAAKTWTIADFEAPGWEERADWKASDAVVVEEKGGKSLRWTLEASANPAAVFLFDIPRDLQEWRLLKFRIRAEGDPVQPLLVRFTAGFGDCVQHEIKVVPKKWTDVEFPLFLMEELGTFDLARLECLSFQVYRGAACTILLDDLRLERGPADPAAADRDRFEYAFGKGGASKGSHVKVGEIELWTDSRAALSKFPEGLARAVAFVRSTLDLPEARRPLDVYLFQNAAGFRDFLVRARGMDRKQADLLNAIGNASYLALYYRAPDDPQFVHELAHSLFHRARGRRGGSWFQEGVGEYVEMRWQGKHPAEEFAPRLRAKSFVPLAEFIVIPDLYAGGDAKGGAGAQEALYLQAAALHEFLRRGPLRDQWPAAQAAIGRMDVPAAERAKALEKILGLPLADLQMAWVEWGSAPPKD